MYRFLACLLPLLALCGFRPAPPLPHMPVALSLVDRESGDEATAYLHRGQQWVAGTPEPPLCRAPAQPQRRARAGGAVGGRGQRLSGQTAAPDQAGYVLEPWQESDITGWRKSSAEVAQFVFTDPGDYASRTGRPANVGVVGIAVFGEARPLSIAPAPAPRPAPLRAQEAGADRAMDASAARAAGAERQQLGTGHGGREASVSHATGFERASRTPVQVSQIRCDTRSRLAAMGIVPGQRSDRAARVPGRFRTRSAAALALMAQTADGPHDAARPDLTQGGACCGSAPVGVVPVQRILEIAHFLLGAILGPAITLLQAPGEVLRIAFGHLEVVVDSGRPTWPAPCP